MHRLLSSPAGRRLMLAMVLAALAVRVLIPAGFMLMPASGGGLPQLVICTGMGALTVPAAAMPHDAGMHHDTPRKHAPATTGEHDCPFAVAATVLAMPDLALPVVVAALSAVALFTAFIVRPGLGLAAPPPPSTGPPASA